VDYAGMNLMKGDDSGALRASLTPGSPAKVVRRDAVRDAVAHDPDRRPRRRTLVESNLILNLNEPNALGDVSWFKPSKYVGVWWSLHLDKESWATGPQARRDHREHEALHRFRREIRLPRRAGGRLERWLGRRLVRQRLELRFPQTHRRLRPGRPRRLREVERRASDRAPRDRCAVSHYERQMDEAFAMFARLGIDAVKTGYVCDAGQIERQDVEGHGRSCANGTKASS
jgi:alpha-glucosidase